MLAGAWPAAAEDGADAAQVSGQGTPYYYYLDGRRHRLWLRTDMVASLPQVPAALSDSEYRRRTNAAQALRAASGRFEGVAEQDSGSSVVRLFAVEENLGRDLEPMFKTGAQSYAASAARRAAGNDYHYSEVFSSHPQGRDYRALPGGVFVKFAPEWDAARVSGWLSSQGIADFRAEKVLRANVYLIQTPPGIEALAVANRLHETGEVVYAEPNWWQPASR